MDECPQYVETYEQSQWRGADMSLIEFLRKTNAAGDIIHWLQKEHKDNNDPRSLTEYAREYKMFGEKVIAAEMVSIFNDKYFGQWLMLFCPFRRVKELLPEHIVHAVPRRYRLFACAWHLRPDCWDDEEQIRDSLRLAAKRDAYIDNALAMIRAQKDIVAKYLDGTISLEDEVPEVDIHAADVVPGLERPNFRGRQLDLEQAVNKRLDKVLAVRQANSEEEAEDLATELEESNSMILGNGMPGTGKTYVADYCIRRAVQKGARALMALPTGMQSARARQRHPNIAIDTCHGAFLFHKPLAEAIAILMQYDMVVIDEALQLSEEEFDRLEQMFRAAGRLVVLLFLGDEWQLPSLHQRKASDHALWASVFKVTLTEIRRSSCPVLIGKLQALRQNRPMGAEGDKLVKHICYQHKAWSGHDEPTTQDIHCVHQKSEGKTTILVCTKRGSALVNKLSTQVLFEFKQKPAIGVIPADYEDEEDNYAMDEEGNYTLRKDRQPLPSQLVLYKDLKIVLTRNRDKQNDFVNGMTGTVENFNEETGCLRVLTQTGKRLAIYRFTDDDVPPYDEQDRPKGRCVYYPVRPGYAGTIYKYQGAELDHVTIWLDRPGCKAAAYVALSRVKKDEDYLLGGVLTPAHFCPAK